MAKPKTATLFIFLFIFASSLLTFYPSLNYYFFQDDWFVLNWIRTGDFLSFFNFRTDIIYWRPLSMPLLFALAKSLFGLNPFGYHLIALTIFFVLLVAIYQLFISLEFTKKLALVAAFIYGIWPIHYISLSWFSTTSYIIGPLFQTLSFIFFIKFINERRRIFQIASFLLFILGIASSEFTLVLPFIFIASGLILGKKFSYKVIIPYILVDLTYLFLRFVAFPLPAKDQYQIFINKQVINNFIWYVLWSLGLPESFKSLIFPSLPSQSIKVITQFWAITIPVFLLFVFLAKHIGDLFKGNSKYFLFGIIWFSIGLLPVITVTNHSYPMYLSFAGLGFLYIILNVLKKTKNLILILFLILWIIASFENLRFTRITHWLRNEQAISKAYTIYAKEKVPDPSKNSVFLFKPANIEFSKDHGFFLVEGEDTLRQSLSDQNAVKVIYEDNTLKSFYVSHQQPITFPKDIHVFEINPRR